MNRMSFILILGIMLLLAGCIDLGSKTEEVKTTPVENTVKTNTTTHSPTPAKVCVESNNMVTYGNESYENKCINKTMLEKVSCKSNAPSKENITCQSGYECDSGSCRVTPKKCVDSDGGENLNVTGTVTYMGIMYTDYCEVGNLHEYYCTNDKMDGITTFCPKASHCVSGQCVYWPPTCTEYATYVKMDPHTGSVVLLQDYCKDNGSLVHYFCEGNVNKSEIIPANATQFCDTSTNNITTKKCTDSDGGAIKEVAGIVRYGLDEYLDKCMGGDTVVKEYFCEDNNVESVVLECELGCAENIIGDNFGSIVGYCS